MGVGLVVEVHYSTIQVSLLDNPIELMVEFIFEIRHGVSHVRASFGHERIPKLFHNQATTVVVSWCSICFMTRFDFFSTVLAISLMFGKTCGYYKPDVQQRSAMRGFHKQGPARKM